jgi:ABC-type polysaccharide/polyol phosphate transport system ATPase subunit
MIGIKLRNIGLDFPIVGIETRSIRWGIVNSLVGGRLGKSKRGYVSRALSNVSVSIGQGERVGIIGANGSGKSTLLRTMAGIYSPTHGSIERQGRTVTMFEISAGMDDELTGLQNIRNRLYFLGLKERASDEVVQSVADFAALGDYIHLPIKTYSMGMRMRLSFAASTLVDPEVLLVDEVFAVGDRDFYDRAQKRISDLLNKAGLLVMASHSDSLLQEFCTRGLVMASGALVFDGPIDDALKYYHSQVDRSQEAAVVA